MARLILSPVVAGISGKAGDAVFAKWKGRQYMRQRVVPANPKSVAQTAQRDAMSECVAIWHLLLASIVTGFGTGAAAQAISGYNDFCKRNVTAVRTAAGLFGPRRNTKAVAPYIETPTDFAYASEPGGGEQRFTWTDTAQGADYRVGLLAYNSTDNVLTIQNPNAVPMSDEEFTISGYAVADIALVAAWVFRVSDDEFVHFGSTAHTQIA